jgi:hypothetical protein
LKQRVPAVPKTRARALHVGRRENGICPARDDDRVLSGIIHADERNPGGFVSHCRNSRDVDTRSRKAGLQVVSKHVVTDASHHSHQRALSEPPGRAGLIGALSARDHLERSAEHRLAGSRQMLGPNHEVHVQTAEDDYCGFHLCKSMPSFFNSSA